MVQYVLFQDLLRQEDIDKFYEACQMQRDWYRGSARSLHPLTMFKEPQYTYQCPPDLTSTYLSFPAYHVRYKQPVVLPPTPGPFPLLPGRTLAGRYNKPACRAYAK